MKLALTFFDIPNLSGGGGAERFFYDFFVDYTKYSSAKNRMIMITDCTENIKRSGREIVETNLISVLNYRYFNYRIFNFLNRRNTFFLGNLVNAIKVNRIIRRNKIDKLIIPFYNPREFYFYRILNFLGVNMDYFIVDCRIPENYHLNAAPYWFRDCYERFFKSIKFDTIHTWYRSVERFVQEQGIITKFDHIRTYKSRYSMVAPLYDPAIKKKTLIFAARMDEQKDPLFFLEAIRLLHSRNALNDIKILMYGEGPLLNEVKNFIAKHQLHMIHLSVSGNLERIFSESRIFVSTQKYENFPSLAITEAMSKGNIIIAKNVGQTELLVKDGENGFLCQENDPGSLADCILKAIELNDDKLDKMARKSVALMREEHTLEKFILQFDEFVRRE
ncbi:MAG: glycosyltransferase family 4 protein [Crocinitomicaceae bacterium]|nr:glycosyltransferase family 4 protein [Crocinitomicaceae bacterium]